jgi:hypothetical protein
VQAQQLFDYFTQAGFSPAQVAGILGNIEQESTFNTGAQNSGA